MRITVLPSARISVLMLVISSLVLVGIERSLACPFCAAVGLTFSQEIKQSEAAVIARLVEPPPASALGPNAEGPLPQAQFEVIDVLKGEALQTRVGHDRRAAHVQLRSPGSLHLAAVRQLC